MSRAWVPRQTVKITKKGEARLSEDLMVAKEFTPVEFNQKKKLLRMKPVKKGGVRVWRSAPWARSGFVSMASILKGYGVDWTKMVGNTYVGAVTDGHLVIDFGTQM